MSAVKGHVVGKWVESSWSDGRDGRCQKSRWRALGKISWQPCLLAVAVLAGLVTAPDYLQASPGEIRQLIHRVAGEERVDAGLLRAIVHVESDFNAELVSEKGAGGLMQLMPETARSLGVKNRFNPEQSLRGGARYIKRLIGMYPNLSLALAAYNAGPGNVDKFGGMPPFPETRSYVRRVMAKYAKEVPARSVAPLRISRSGAKVAKKKPDNDRKSQPVMPESARRSGVADAPEVYGFLHRSSYLGSRDAISASEVPSEIFGHDLVSSVVDAQAITEIPIIRLVSN
ncbi:MAG: lytic transglycosylase domain-containing protein [Nitrospirae bacterium]|nr:lytic transglycosylase domain-containing protein [Magnetococcales bacterium]